MFKNFLSALAVILVVLFFIVVFTTGAQDVFGSKAVASVEYEPVTATELKSTFGWTVYEFVDNETGVCYLFVSGAEKCAITPMYERNGMLKVKR